MSQTLHIASNQFWTLCGRSGPWPVAGVEKSTCQVCRKIWKLRRQ